MSHDYPGIQLDHRRRRRRPHASLVVLDARTSRWRRGTPGGEARPTGNTWWAVNSTNLHGPAHVAFDECAPCHQ